MTFQVRRWVAVWFVVAVIGAAVALAVIKLGPRVMDIPPEIREGLLDIGAINLVVFAVAIWIFKGCKIDPDPDAQPVLPHLSGEEFKRRQDLGTIWEKPKRV